MILRIPLVGTPFRLPLTERIVDIAALVVSVDLIGERGGDKYQRRSHDTGRWQNVERHDVLLAAAAQPHAIDARRHALGDGHLEIGIPAAIIEVVLVEMDRGVMPWPMPPGCLFASPARAAYRPRRQIAQGAMQRVRPAVEDAVACRESYRAGAGDCKKCRLPANYLETPLADTFPICRATYADCSAL